MSTVAGNYDPDPVTVSKGEKFQKRYPPPTVKLAEHPWKWIHNKIIQVGLSVIGTHLALFVWVAVYYMLFELVHPVKHFWDTLLTQQIHTGLSVHEWGSWRHFIRDGGEAGLATITVLFFFFNPFTHKVKEIHTVGEVVGRCLVTLAIALPLMILGALAFQGLQALFHTGTLAPELSAHPNIAQKLYSSGWTTKVAVVLAFFLARRPMYPVFALAQKVFAERRAYLAKRDHWWQAAPFRALVRILKARPELIEVRSNAVAWTFRLGVIIFLMAAGGGYYILQYIA